MRKIAKNLTVIDYLVLLLLVGVGLFFVSKFSRTEKTVLVDLTFERTTPGNNFFPPEYWRTESITVGDPVYNSLGNNIAVVKKVTRLPWGGGARFYIYVTMEMTALYHKAQQVYTYEGSPLVIGQRIDLTVGGASYTGVIKKVYEKNGVALDKGTKKQARVSLYCREYESWHAEAISHLEVKDQNGNLMAKILESTIVPAQVAVETSDGRIVQARHPFKKDLELDIALYNLSCTPENLCFFNETQSFTIGSQLWLDSGKTWVGQNCSVKDFQLLDL